jgi:hypothetical protein
MSIEFLPLAKTYQIVMFSFFVFRVEIHLKPITKLAKLLPIPYFKPSLVLLAKSSIG